MYSRTASYWASIVWLLVMKHQPTGAHQVEGAAEEIVVDAETGIGPVAHVGDLVLAERDVADHQVEPVVGQGVFSKGKSARPRRRARRAL